jgi:hypothetical protein
VPSQQPPAQLDALHTHWPETQAWPAAQAGPPPHEHAPAVQPSLRVVAQLPHTAPPSPHSSVVGCWQTPLKQHPVGQLVGSQPVQVAPSQVEAGGHSWQRAPPVPHAVAARPCSQKSPLQQPPQVAAEQRGPSGSPASTPASAPPASATPASMGSQRRSAPQVPLAQSALVSQANSMEGSFAH